VLTRSPTVEQNRPGQRLALLVATPFIAMTGGWLLAGREPSAIGQRPLE